MNIPIISLFFIHLYIHYNIDNHPIIIWLVVEPPTPLKNDGELVSWDDDIPFPINDGKVMKSMETSHHQAVINRVWEVYPNLIPFSD